MADRRDDFDALVQQFRGRQLDRRAFARRAGALGLSALTVGAIIGPAVAQDATPGASPVASPAASPGATPGASPVAVVPGASPGTRSITRAEYNQLVREQFEIEEPGATGGQVIYGSTANLRTVNAVLRSDTTSGLIVDRVFEYLVQGSAVDGSVVPQLAESWELAADGITYTFTLPPNVTWHDGTAFTAEDIRFSYDAAVNPDTNSQYAATALAAMESYRVVDATTFEITSKGPLATFLYDVPNSLPVVPRHIWEGVPPAEWENDPGSTGQDPSRVIGTGPFRFQEYVEGESARVVRNDAYYDTVPSIDEYVVRIVPDDTALVQALKTGEIDVAGLPTSQVEDVRNTEGMNVLNYPSLSFWYYITNLDPAKTPLFQDKRVRQALFYGIDRQAIVDNVVLGFGEVAQGPQPRLSPAYAPDRITTKYTYDPDRARQLLAEAGWVDSDGDGIVENAGQKLSFEWLSVAGNSEYEQMLTYVQEAWREIGVEMTPQFVDFSILLENLNGPKDYQVCNLGFSWDANGDQGAMFRTDAYEGGFNRMRYSNPEFDRLDELQRRELDPQKRIDILIEQANMINEDVPIGILIFRDTILGHAQRLHNFRPNGYTTWWSLPYAWVEPQ